MSRLDFEEANLTEPAENAEKKTSDLLSGRKLTTHERVAGQPWNASYENGPAPWDIGRPQGAIVRLASSKAFRGPVLDAGCGTGENSLHIAALGLSVLGVDVAETALAMARKKAEQRWKQNPELRVEFLAADAFHLERLGRKFQTVLDCGLFHAFEGDERTEYAASLARVAERGGSLFVLCFSDEGDEIGPHPVSQSELQKAFNSDTGWNVAEIQRERIETRFYAHGASAWLATIGRL